MWIHTFFKINVSITVGFKTIHHCFLIVFIHYEDSMMQRAENMRQHHLNNMKNIHFVC